MCPSPSRTWDGLIFFERMSIMKKFICMMFCLCTLLSFAACGNEPVNTPAAEPIEKPEVQPTPEVTPEPTPEPMVDEAALALDLSDAKWELSGDGSYYQL